MTTRRALWRASRPSSWRRSATRYARSATPRGSIIMIFAQTAAQARPLAVNTAAAVEARSGPEQAVRQYCCAGGQV